MTVIAVNTIIEWLEGGEDTVLDRVLWIAGPSDRYVSIRLHDKKALPVWQHISDTEQAFSQGHAIKRTIDPFAALSAPDEGFLAKYREYRDSAWAVIKDMVIDEPAIYDEIERGRLIREASKKHNVHKMTVYKYLRRYWWGGKIINALLPEFSRCGGIGKERSLNERSAKRGRPTIVSRQTPDRQGLNVDEDIKRLFRYALDNYYLRKDGPDLRTAYNDMLRHHFNIGFREENGEKTPIMPASHLVPSIGQFKYWANKFMDLEKTLTARKGDRAFQLRHRAVLGDSTQMAIGPGSIYQIDATVADVYLVNRLNRSLIIGRPVVYAAIDVFSRVIAGLYVGLEGPSWLGAMMAVANAITDKVAYCARYGISISPDEWPCRFLPEKIMADRGEFISNASDLIVDSLNIDIDNTPPYRADWKGIVEQHFRCINLKGIKWIPGAVRKRERGEKDCRLDAQLDIEQFTRILIHNARRHNSTHWMEWYPCPAEVIQDGISPIPLDLWNWGIANRIGHLRETTPERAMLALMPRDTARVTPQGILFQGMHYSCERAEKEQWFVHARNSGRWSLQASYDPRHMDVIYLHLQHQLPEVCHLLAKDLRFAGATYEDVIDWRYHVHAAKNRHADREMQGQANYDARVQAILEESARMKQTDAGKATNNRQSVKGIKDNRKEEREQLRQEEAWKLPETDKGVISPQLAQTAPPPVPSASSIQHDSQVKASQSKKVTFLKILKQQREKSEE